MADNVTSNPGAGGYIFATDEVGGAHHPYTKMEYGADGEATPVSSANPLPVTLTLPAGQTEQPVADTDARNFLQRIMQILLAPLGYDKSLQRYRGTVAVESLPTLANVTTVTTLNNFNGRNADMLVNAQVNACWALNVRARIT